MSPRLRSALAPALGALLAGGLAVAAGAGPLGVLAVATLAAGAASLATGVRPGRAVPARADAPAPAAGSGAEALLDALPVGVLVIAADGTIRLANHSAADVFGLPGGPLPAAALRAPRLLERVAAARRDGAAGTVEFTLPRRGELRLRAHVRPAGEGAVVVTLEDRTEAFRAQELHRDFVANASHELKTPLAAISATIETLRGHARDDPAATERFLALMAEQAARMTRLVDDLLSLNRVELNERVAPRDAVDPSAILADAVEALRPAAGRAGARLILDWPGQAPPVRGDRHELAQLFRNLVENAIRHGGPGVEVRIGPAAPRPDMPGMAGIAVRDTGPGIPREHLPRLTERFYRVPGGRAAGTGLGLAIVKHILARHRGRLEIDSTPGEGASFTVWLPLAEAGQPADGTIRAAPGSSGPV